LNTSWRTGIEVFVSKARINKPKTEKLELSFCVNVFGYRNLHKEGNLILCCSYRRNENSVTVKPRERNRTGNEEIWHSELYKY
jgi:hypothetical protein